MSKAETNLCRNCGLSEETIEHLFFHCAKVKEFLLNINRLAKPLTGIKCRFTIQEVLLGVIRVGSHSDALNILLLLIKDYIFQETLKGFSLNITAFSHKLHQIYKEQEFLATINSQLPTFLPTFQVKREYSSKTQNTKGTIGEAEVCNCESAKK